MPLRTSRSGIFDLVDVAGLTPLPALGKTVREVAAELTFALGGVMPDTTSA
jgi:hypothetical protein